MKAIGPAILLLFPILLLSCASGNHEPFAENPPIARDLDALETELRVLCDGSELLELEEAGRVEYDGFSAPIWVVRHRPFGAERRVRMVILRTRDGLIDAPRWGLKYMRLTGQLSLTNYLRLEHSREVYTIF
jgi:hypothetical protein